MASSVLKKLGLATALLLAVWIVYVYRLVPHEAAPFAKVSGKAERIVLEQDGRQVELRKEAGRWKVGSSSQTFFAADGNSVNTLMTGLKDLQLDDEISSRSDRASDYDVTAASAIAVRLEDAKGTRLVQGLFGKQAPDMAHIYFRYPDKPNVYLGRGVIRGDLGRAEVNFWRDRHLLDIPEAKIQSVRIDGKGFSTEVVKTSTDSWSVNGKPVDPSLPDALAGVLAHSQVDEFVDPSADSKLTFEGLTYARISVKGTESSAELYIGAQDPKTKRYPVSMGKAFGLGWMSQSAAESLLKKPSYFKPK